MNTPQLVLTLFASLAVVASAQQTDLSNKPSVIVENNKERPKKDVPLRIIRGTVNDQSENPVPGAIVQLKNTKTSKVVDFATKDDGKFTFRELPMDVDFELLAKHGVAKTAVRRVTVWDNRKEVTINFKLEPAKQK